MADSGSAGYRPGMDGRGERSARWGRRVLTWIKVRHLTLISVGILLLLLSLDYVLLRPLFIKPANKDTAVAVAAAITVNGALLTAAVTYAGLLFKRSADSRTAELAEQANRTAELEEQRLQTEAAMKAVGLLVTSEGKSVPPFQASALLMVLAQLGHLRLALDLVGELWPEDLVTRTAAVELIDRAMGGSDEDERVVACRILSRHADRLVFTQDVATPQGVQRQVTRLWPRHLRRSAGQAVAPQLQELLDRAEQRASEREALLASQQLSTSAS